ncbi:MAG: LacI family transcriptional regulator [Actinomycetota bacterium]|nr:LacI family transcriptional regulator [Actinomycetota bacterium]
MAPTIRHVAELARVSPSTVSRALASPELVNVETRQRVRAAADKLGYRPNRAARGLITGRTGNLGMIVPDLSNPFFAAVAKGVQARARERDHAVFIADTDEETDAEADLVLALSKQVDGIVLCSPRMLDGDLGQIAVQSKLVLLNRRFGDCPSISVDNSDGMRQAIAHLVALGHRSIAYVGGPRTSWSNAERSSGLREAAAAAGIDLVEVGHFHPQFGGGVAAADIVVASGATAVIAYNDVVAIGLLSRLGARGIAVPRDLSVVGCDDIAMSMMSHPALTTVSVPQQSAGRAAVELLLAVLEDDERVGSRQRELPTQLMVRASSGIAPTA